MGLCQGKSAGVGNMIWDLITGFLPDWWGYIATAVGGVVLYLLGRSTGAAKANGKQAEAGLKATTKGNAAARKGKAEAAEKLKQGQTPEDIVRGNDAEWR